MIIAEISKIKSTKEELKKFGITVGIALGLLGAFFLWKERWFYHYFLAASVSFIIFGAALPSILMPVQKTWMAFAIVMGFLMTRLILTLLFYLVVTPVALIAKLVRKDFLDMRIDREAQSYWRPRIKKIPDKATYERQY